MKILIVDDSESFRSKIKLAFEAQGYEIVEGSDGVEGIKKIQTIPDIKLVLCDVNMPNMDGLTMCQKIKADGLIKVPILMLTSEGAPELMEKAKEAGVVAWVPKACTMDKLIGNIKRFIG